MRCGFAAALLAALAAFDAGASSPQSDEAIAKLPDAAGVVSGYTTVRRWVDAFDAPPLDDARAQRPVQNSSGACVILRRAGRVLGIGTDLTPDGLMLRRAAGKAMTDVLGDPALASISAQIQSDAAKNPDAALTVESLRADLGRKLTLEIEIAGTLTPLIGRSLEQMARALEPGVDGLAIRRGQAWEFLFPAQTRATNTGGDPERLLLNLAMQSGIPLKEVGNLSQRPDIGLYSFRTIDLTQSAPGRSAFQVFRGDTLVLDGDVTAQSIAAFADGVTRHLLASMWSDAPRDDANSGSATAPALAPRGLMGTYSMVGDVYRPLVAPALDQALAAMALLRYAKAPGVDPALAKSAADAALKLLRTQGEAAPVDPDPRPNVAASAAVVYAVTESRSLRDDASIDRLFTDSAKRVMSSFDQASGFVERDPNGHSQNIAPHVQALLAGAMSRLLLLKSASPVSIDAAIVRRAIDAAWRSAPQPQHVGLLPWIGWAESDWALATSQPPAHDNELRLLIQLLHDSQIGPGPRQGASELGGGFALTEEATDSFGPPRATSQSIRPAAWLAEVIRNPNLTAPDQANALMERQLKALRFLMQLSVREPTLGSVRNPQRALGGIRSSLWDSDQPVPAQALGLIAASDTLTSLATAP